MEAEEAQPISHHPYTPPAQFKPITLPPLFPEAASDDTELWLIRIPDSRLGPDDIKGKRVSMRLQKSFGNLGSFESTNGHVYDITCLDEMEGMQPYAFLPTSNNENLKGRKISRQVTLVRNLDTEAKSLSISASIPQGSGYHQAPGTIEKGGRYIARGSIDSQVEIQPQGSVRSRPTTSTDTSNASQLGFESGMFESPSKSKNGSKRITTNSPDLVSKKSRKL